MYICLYVYVCVYIYMYMYVCIYIYKHSHAPVVHFYIKMFRSSTRAYKAERKQTVGKPS